MEWKASRADLDEHSRARYDRYDDMLSGYGAPVRWIYATTVASALLMAGGVAVAIATVDGFAQDDYAAITWGSLFILIVLGGLVAAAVVDTRIKSAARRACLAMLAEVPPPSPRRSDVGARSGDGTNWARYPVTGTYNPEEYHARGGRSTAAGMETWGVDYETYRSNIE
jgi:hypothetical protein